ncbi:signal recognition particle, SRP19 subunit [Hypoxylon trugodes]|uniref:signal recognition particle, SRP19 subunit n=1 Tax=Hypoxylon trugodes TaxID=326681 RepID=UPI00218D6694|nr:signal recognition particle, SRP19 subunit [Hypoxylon trugodes]KAI1388487.1 signal recognition particle, SRP19 subunit [Hypoxylon trugodes]
MSHARIEEVSDSDLSDPSEGDIDDFVESDILRQKQPPTTTTSSSRPSTQIPPSSGSFLQHPSTAPAQQVQASDIKDYQMLYPVYFDSTRSRAEGRRVPKSLAVTNPLAREIASACASLRLSPVFEAHRIHPKDWANPGRVRVKLPSKSSSSSKNNNPYAADVKNKHHLYILIAKHLQSNPTTDHSDALRRVRVPGLNAPSDEEPWPRPAVPRGWKMGELLPAYSAAMTGGGVSENAFKDMMREMQGGPGGPGGPGGMPADMMSMLGQGMGGFGGPGGMGMPGLGGAGPSESSGGGGGGKKGKKGKGRA